MNHERDSAPLFRRLGAWFAGGTVIGAVAFVAVRLPMLKTTVDEIAANRYLDYGLVRIAGSLLEAFLAAWFRAALLTGAGLAVIRWIGPPLLKRLEAEDPDRIRVLHSHVAALDHLGLQHEAGDALAELAENGAATTSEKLMLAGMLGDQDPASAAGLMETV